MFKKGSLLQFNQHDGDTQPVWIARALSDPDCNPEEPTRILIRYFHPTSRTMDVQEFYTG